MKVHTLLSWVVLLVNKAIRERERERERGGRGAVGSVQSKPTNGRPTVASFHLNDCLLVTMVDPHRPVSI